jgi:hypothetical protein
MKPVQVACTASVEELLIIVQIEAIEINTLAALNLVDA